MTDHPSTTSGGTGRDPDELAQRISDIERGIRRIAHDMSNPLGIIRMAIYFLQSADPDEEKRKEYFQLLNQSIDRIDGHLAQLRGLTERVMGSEKDRTSP